MRASVTGLVLLALAHAGPSRGAEPPAEARIERWLVLGPASYPLPLLADPAPGPAGIEALFEDEPLDEDTLVPRAGGSVRWFGGEDLRWTERPAGRGGRVELSVSDAAAPAVAWLAVYLNAERWTELELELLGAHPRRAWLDGSSLVQGGLDEADEEVIDDIQLSPGQHVLLLLTLRDPQRDAAWDAGAVLRDGRGGGLDTVGRTTSTRRAVELRDVIDAPQITSLALSPDGTRLAASVTRPLHGSEQPRCWIEIRRADDGDVIESRPQSDPADHVEWSPDGRWLSYLSHVDDDAASLVLVDRVEPRSFALLDGADGLVAYRWLPDASGVIVASRREEEAEDDSGVRRLRGLLERRPEFRDETALALVSVPDGARRPLVLGRGPIVVLDVSPDSARLLLEREVEDLEHRPYSRFELWQLDLATMQAAKLRDFRRLDGASWAPDGRRLLVLAGPAAFEGEGLALPSRTVANSYDTQAFVWDPAAGRVEAITRGFDPTVASATWSRRDGRIYLQVVDRDYTRLVRYDPDGPGFTLLDAGVDVVSRWRLAEGAPVAAVAGSSPWAPERLALVDLERATARRIGHPADDSFADVVAGSVEPWSFTGPGGRTVPGRVYLPPGFDPARRYPAIVYYYGGTLPVDRAFGGRFPLEWWASRGYVVYVIQPSGAIGFGQPRSALLVNDWGRTATREVLEGTRRFLETHPYVDPQRVGAIGASYGGFLTLLLSTETDRFAAVVSHAGISSIPSYWGAGLWGYSYGGVAAADSFPWNRSDLFVEQSPLFRADRVRAPVLLTHGTDDDNVPIGQSEALFTALKLLGKPVEFVQIEDQGHLIVAPERRRLWSSAILAWFDRWLKGQPEWWDALF